MRGYRSLLAWQRAHVLCLAVLKVVDRVRRPQTFAICDQLVRAAISVEANLVEGYALGSVGQFRRHVRIATGSAAEVECLLGIGLEAGYLPEAAASDLRKELDRVIGLLFGVLRSPRIGKETPL